MIPIKTLYLPVSGGNTEFAFSSNATRLKYKMGHNLYRSVKGCFKNQLFSFLNQTLLHNLHFLGEGKVYLIKSLQRKFLRYSVSNVDWKADTIIL